MIADIARSNNSESMIASQKQPDITPRAAAAIVCRAVSHQEDRLQALYGSDLVEEAKEYARQVVHAVINFDDPEGANSEAQVAAVQWAARAPRVEDAIEQDPTKPPAMWRFNPCRQLVQLGEEDLEARHLYAEAAPSIPAEHQTILDAALLMYAGSELDKMHGGEALDYAQSIGLVAANQSLLRTV